MTHKNQKPSKTKETQQRLLAFLQTPQPQGLSDLFQEIIKNRVHVHRLVPPYEQTNTEGKAAARRLRLCSDGPGAGGDCARGAASPLTLFPSRRLDGGPPNVTGSGAHKSRVMPRRSTPQRWTKEGEEDRIQRELCGARSWSRFLTSFDASTKRANRFLCFIISFESEY